jgi:PAS domain S-box-containing protein
MSSQFVTSYLKLSGRPDLAGWLWRKAPALLFSGDGQHVLWANPAGAALLGARDVADLLGHRFSAAHPITRQVARAKATLRDGQSRLDLLRLGSLRARPLAFRISPLALAGGGGLLALADPAPEPSFHASARDLAAFLAAGSGSAAVIVDGEAVGSPGGFAPHEQLLTAPEAMTVDLPSPVGTVRLFVVPAQAGPAQPIAAPAAPASEAIAVDEAPEQPSTPEPDPAPVAPGVPAAEGLAEPVEAIDAPTASPAPAAAPEEPAAEVETADIAEAKPAEAETAEAATPEREPAPATAAEEPTVEPGPEEEEAPEPAETDAAAGQAAEGAGEPESRPLPSPPRLVEPVETVRFAFQLDAEQRFIAIGKEFASVVGAANADVVGHTFQEVAGRLGLDNAEPAINAMSRRDTWSGVTLYWPVEGSDQKVAVDFAALPAFSRARVFEGFRGFGVCRLRDRKPRDGAAAETANSAAAAEEQSNVVRLPGAPQERPGPRLVRPSLNGLEQDAFRRIAEALGATLPDGSAAEEGAAAPPQPGEDAAPPADTQQEAAAGETAPLPELRVLDRLPLAIAIVRGEEVAYANTAFLDLLLYPSLKAFAAGGGLDGLLERGGRADDDEGAARTLAARRADGSRLPVEARLQRIPWGEAGALIITLKPADEDRAKTLAAELDAARARARQLETILDTATDGVVVLDGEGRISAFNRAAQALFGVEAGEVVGKSFFDLLEDESRTAALDYVDGLASNGVASVLNDGREIIGKVADRGVIPLFITMGRLGDSGKFCAVLRDITQWKKAEEELVAARRAAEAANAQKSEFLAKISHEIRTPLNAVIGFSEVMMEERFGPIGNERYREYLRDIHLSGSHLMSLINDLLDLSKIEAGKIELSFDAVAVNAVIQECVALMQPQANRERIIIRTSLGPDVPSVVADARSLRQIILNLLSNAVKFTQPGGQVIVSTKLEETGEVVIRIRDTGVGMSEKDIEAAMKPFRQLATSGRERFDGTGLGLPLTKAMVEANRASFTITSAIDQGTMVRIAFPSPRVLAG